MALFVLFISFGVRINRVPFYPCISLLYRSSALKEWFHGSKHAGAITLVYLIRVDDLGCKFPFQNFAVSCENVAAKFIVVIEF